MRHFFLTSLAISIGFMTFSCSSDEPTPDQPDYPQENPAPAESVYSVEGDYAVLKKAPIDEADFVIPSEITIDGVTYPVTKIGVQAFYDNDVIKTVHIPSSIRTIESEAFLFSGIQEVYIESLEAWCNIDFYFITSNPIKSGTTVYIEGEPVTDTLTIPSGITEISPYAFTNLNITGLVISEGVETIGGDCFSNNKNLKEITLPSTITNLGDYNFSNSPVERINIPDINAWLNIKYVWSVRDSKYDDPSWYPETITEYTTQFNDYWLYINGEKVEDVVVPEETESITNFLFAGCNIKSITLSEGVKSIGVGAFYNCQYLKSVKLPETLESINLAAFLRSTVEDVNFPSSLKKLGANAFYGSKIKEAVIPGSVGMIDRGTFAFCNELDKVELGKGIEVLGEEAFYGSSVSEIKMPETLDYAQFNSLGGCNFKSLTFPEGFATLSMALTHNAELEYICYPSTLKTIREDYVGCRALKTIEVKATQVPVNSDNTRIAVAESCTLYVPAVSLEAYKADPYWGQFKHIEGKDF